MKQHTSAWRMIALLCVAQVFVQIGAFFWPALLPRMVQLWDLSNSEAGWITAIFYGAYLVSVPILVTLTDRIDPKRIYLFGVAATVIGHLLFAVWAHDFWSAMAARALTGMGWAGTYMTGLKLLADRVDAKTMSRATASHAASIGIAGAMSFAVGDIVADAAGWQAPFLLATVTSAIAWLLIALLAPRQTSSRQPDSQHALFDFRPVFRNRSAMAYAFVYAMHTLEMSAVRGWGVAFLGYVAMKQGTGGSATISPAIVVTVLALLGTVASIGGNEASIRFGRRRLIKIAVGLSITFALLTGFFGTYSYLVATLLLFAYGFSIWLDSSSLTAGTAGTAEPSRRGATLAVHSMLGYAGGFLGPLIVGLALDFSGGMSDAGWSTAFAVLSAFMLCALIVFWWINPNELAGDRQGNQK